MRNIIVKGLTLALFFSLITGFVAYRAGYWGANGFSFPMSPNGSALNQTSSDSAVHQTRIASSKVLILTDEIINTRLENEKNQSKKDYDNYISIVEEHYEDSSVAVFNESAPSDYYKLLQEITEKNQFYKSHMRSSKSMRLIYPNEKLVPPEYTKLDSLNVEGKLYYYKRWEVSNIKIVYK
ncbi:MAG: hypothetical protein HRT71_00960 [Flavobacteriales bacterium]|nr:hypothetical protein [Flavobacteriales bacterium]